MTTDTTDAPAPPVIDPVLFARGMAVIRIFFGSSCLLTVWRKSSHRWPGSTSVRTTRT